MTLGQKIKEARKNCLLSQEQFAEKMNVSRSAVAKWETDKGLPDVDNLKLIAKTLNVSVDYLLDDGEQVDMNIVREPYDITKYGKGMKKRKNDRMIAEKFEGCEIHTLLPKYKATKKEHVIGDLLALLTDAPFGVPQFIMEVKNADKEYYLIEKDNEQLFVMVTKEFIETRKLAKKVTDKKFRIGDWMYIKCPFEPK